ncbi:hypothetical protein AXF42_Ash018709 [Apostasia shenzhenica]|uniref:Uncharacterized protein n=1 Tax=Apostasia shenzhenica TaxID=1088818 RepID=A0A2H9ZZT0_9ASPA|nr:hypothetical protein AXF42_Ash018709 [Apostasia shenzhenica]
MCCLRSDLLCTDRRLDSAQPRLPPKLRTTQPRRRSSRSSADRSETACAVPRRFPHRQINDSGSFAHSSPLYIASMLVDAGPVDSVFHQKSERRGLMLFARKNYWVWTAHRSDVQSKSATCARI